MNSKHLMSALVIIATRKKSVQLDVFREANALVFKKTALLDKALKRLAQSNRFNVG